MNWSKASALAEIVSSAAIVATLVYLAIQTRQVADQTRLNTEAVRSQELAQGEAFERERQLLLASDPVFVPVYMKSLYEPSSMTLEDIHRVTHYLVSRVDALRRCYQSYSDGITEQKDWDDCVHYAPLYLGGDFGRVWWDYIKQTDYSQDPEFVADVDRSLASPSVVPDDQWFLNFQKVLREAGLQ